MFIKLNLAKKLESGLEIKETGAFYSIASGTSKFLLKGKFYYHNSRELTPVLFHTDPEKQLASIIKKGSLEDFINSTEGEYVGAAVNYKNQTLTIFSDKLKQAEFYYYHNSHFFWASDDPKRILDDARISDFDSNALICAVISYVPKGHMLFRGLRRLKYNELITVEKNKIRAKTFDDRNVNIEEYAEKDLDRYAEIYKNAILSRASKKLNLVFSSGGWDSTALLFMLSRHLGKDKVRGITMKIVMSDGSCFNEFEVNKVLEIGKILGVKMDVVEMNYGKNDLYARLDEVKSLLFYRNIFSLAPGNWSGVVSYIKEKYGEAVVIFNGEACDSLHNYGFSQYISIPHENDDFAEYADKMKNYLFGPTFFKKIKSGSYLKDSVYQIFLNQNRDKEFVSDKNLGSKQKALAYLLSFVLSDVRLPFRKLDITKYVRKEAAPGFVKWLEENYFDKAAEEINEKNLYYHFSRLYVLFHLQSPQLQIFRGALKNVRFPYIDLNLFRFLYKMPEAFGRGLNFNSIKYPLKSLVKKNFPKELLKVVQTGPHSYLSEVKDVNIYDDYLLQGPIYGFMKDNIDMKKIKAVFPTDKFHINELQKLVSNFKQGKLSNLSSIDGRLLMTLALLNAHAEA